MPRCQVRHDIERDLAFEREILRILGEIERRRRRRGEGSVPALVEPPRGPKPLAGGAAAPLEFD